MTDSKSEIQVSILIVNHNTRELLRDCLNSIEMASAGLDVETFVVDNGSSDGSAALVREEFPKVCLIENKDNPGFARANNQAWEKSRGRYLLLLNSDATLLENTLAQAVSYMDANTEVGALGPKTWWDPGRVFLLSAFRLPGLTSAFTELTSLARLFPNNLLSRRYWTQNHRLWMTDLPTAVESVPGAFMFLRREVSLQVGLFDERFFMFYEDVDLCRRIRKSGWKIYYVPQVEYVHRFGQSWKQKGPGKVSEYVSQSLIAYYRKHFGGVGVILLKGLFLCDSLFSKVLGSVRGTSVPVTGSDESRKPRCTASPDGVRIEWAVDNLAESYLVEVSPDANFVHCGGAFLKSEYLDLPREIWDLLPKMSYFVRVAPVLMGGEVGRFEYAPIPQIPGGAGE